MRCFTTIWIWLKVLLKPGIQQMALVGIVIKITIYRNFTLCFALWSKNYKIIRLVLSKPHEWMCSYEQCHDTYNHYRVLHTLNMPHSRIFNAAILDVLIPDENDAQRKYTNWADGLVMINLNHLASAALKILILLDLKVLAKLYAKLILNSLLQLKVF